MTKKNDKHTHIKKRTKDWGERGFNKKINTFIKARIIQSKNWIKIKEIISKELEDVKNTFSVSRRTKIVEFEGNFEDEDLIEKEEMVVTVRREGYIKRTALTEYREQRRGGKGTQGMNTKETDVVTNLFVANTHTPLLFFSSKS